MTARWIFDFGQPLPPEASDPKAWLGGKGFSLAEMTRARLPVPAGFTIVTAACEYVLARAATSQSRSSRGDETLTSEVPRVEGGQSLLTSPTTNVDGSSRGHETLTGGRAEGQSLLTSTATSIDGTAQWPEGLEAELHAAVQRLEAATDRAFPIPNSAFPIPRSAFPIPRSALRLAVRSGAAVSMPGMMDTVLNVGAGADPWRELVDAINAVFRSWNSERAVAYRAQHRLGHQGGTAVTVQAMFDSEVAGVLFTHDPTNVPARRVVIEAARGLGDAVVAGAVTPDRFLIQRANWNAVQIFPGEPDRAPVLNPSELRQLCELAKRVEKHFGVPMDIEWGVAGGKFALFQCRPIRGIEVALDAEACRDEEIQRLRDLSQRRRRVWVAHNLGETLPHPTPLTWDIVRHYMSGDGGFGRMYESLGFRAAPVAREQGFLELIFGRIYADPERLAQLFWDGLPMRYDLAEVARDPQTLNRAPSRFDMDEADGLLLFRLPRLVAQQFQCAKKLKLAAANAASRFEKEIVPPFLEYVRTRRVEDLTTRSTERVIESLHERRRHVLDLFGAESLKPGFFGATALESLEQRLVQLLGAEEGARLTRTLTSALDNDLAVAQRESFGRLARGEISQTEFLEKFGHRAAGEMELMEPRWRDNPAALEAMLFQSAVETKETPLSPAGARLCAEHQPQQSGGSERPALDTRCGWPSAQPRSDASQLASHEAFRTAFDALPATLERAGGSSLREEILADLQQARALLPFREIGRHYLMMGYELIRLAVLELARRWNLGDDIFFLRLDELERFERERDKLLPLIASRKLRWQSAQRLRPRDVIDSAALDDLFAPPPLPAQGDWHGEPLAPGVAEGPACVVHELADAVNVPADAILVCPSTDPGWTPLFLRVRGLIVERGGVLSHGAIVARDFGLPAVVCPGATQQIRPGERIRVDGDSGRITSLEPREATSAAATA